MDAKMNPKTREYMTDLITDYRFYFSRALNRVMVAPDMIQIMLTSKCNIRCKICDVWKQDFNPQMTTEEVKRLIDQAIELGVRTIYFTGGEAFLRQDIFELIDYASRPGIITTVNTNGSIITDEMARKIVGSRLRNITFSIDSAQPELHNSIRGKDVFEKAIKGIGLVNHYKKELLRRFEDNPEGRLDVGMVSVIMKHNIAELPGLVKLAQDMQCGYIAFQPLVYNGSLLDNANFQSDFWLDEQDIIRLEAVFKELEAIREKMFTQGFYPFGIDFMPEKTIQHFRKERIVNTCFVGFSRIFVNPQGDISFVCFEPLGNIRNSSLKEAWLSQKAYEIRSRIKECRVNCTQFCSERPESEDIGRIHKRFIQETDALFEAESAFLQHMAQETKIAAQANNNDFQVFLEQIKDILESTKSRPRQNG